MLNYYIAKIRAVDCFIDIRINDLPLFVQYVGGETSCSIPINDMLSVDEFQLLTVNMLPLPQKKLSEIDTSCEIAIWLYDGEQRIIQPISEMTTISMTKEDLLATPSRTFCQKAFSAYTRNNVSRWYDCIDLSDIQSIKDITARFYSKIGQLLQTKQYDKYAELISRREKHLVKTLYLDEQEITLRQNMLIERLEQGFTLVTLSGKETLHMYANGKAVSLLMPDYKSALRFVKEGTTQFLTVNLLLGMSEKDYQMIII